MTAYGTTIKPNTLSQKLPPNLALYRYDRSHKVQGNWGTVNLNTIDARRMSMNANSSIMMRNTQSSYGIGNASYSQNISVQNGSNSFYAGQVIGQGLNLLGGIIGALGNKNASPTPQGIKALDSSLAPEKLASLSTPSATAALNAMSQATTAGDLSQAITTAEGEYSTMQTQDSSLKAAADKAQSSMKTLQSDVGKEQSNVDNLSKSVTDGEQQVTGLNSQLQKLDAGYASACQTVDTKQTLLDNATKSYNDAEAKLNSTPKTLEDGTPNPAYATAESQFNIAKSAKEKAEKELEAAKKDKQKAFDDLGDKKNEVKEAEDKLNQMKNDVKTAKDGLENAKKKLEEAKKALDDANGAIKKYQDNAKDMQALKGAIDSNKARLEKLKQNEQKELQSLNEKISKDEAQNKELSGKINGSDGYSKKELKNMSKIDKNNDENQARRERSAELINSQLKLKIPTIGTDGNEYRTMTLNGQTYYSCNNQMITQEEYNAGLGTA